MFLLLRHAFSVQNLGTWSHTPDPVLVLAHPGEHSGLAETLVHPPAYYSYLRVSEEVMMSVAL